MAGGRKRLVHVVSHGPNCLDGVTAAAAVGRYYANERVVTLFAANNESDKVIQSVMPAGGRLHDLWITDLSWVTYDTASHLKHLRQSGTRLFWIDHHRTAVSRAANPEFQVPFTGKVLT